MKKLLVGLFLFGFLTVGIQQVHASVLSDALLKIKSLQQEISQLKTVLKGTVAGIPEPPTLGNTTVTATATGVTISSSVASLGYPASLIARGTCFGLETQGPMSNCLNEGGKTSGPFTQTRTGLTPNTKYMAISYAINETATNWSNTVSFTTPASVAPVPGGWTDWVNSGSCTSNGQAQVRYCTNPAPLNGGSCAGLPTQQVSCAFSSVPTVSYPTSQSITENRAMLGATVTSNGYPMTILENGICFGTTLSATPSTSGTNCIKSASQQTLVYATNLTPNTTYKFRGYATNATGTGYSQEGTFTTLGGVTLPAGCTSTLKYSPTTGILCGSQNIIAVATCLAGQSFNSTTGQPCSQINPRSITVLSPNNGTEVYTAGQQITVKWKTENYYDNITEINLLPQGASKGTDAITLVKNIPNNGSYIVTLPNISNLSVTNFQIEIMIGSSLNNDITSDLSDNFFTINSSSSTTPSITVTSPKGGEIYNLSDTIRPTWTTTNIPSTTAMNVSIIDLANSSIEYSLGSGDNGFGTRINLTPSIAQAPSLGKNNFKIKMTAYGVYSYSNTFTINSAPVTGIVSPCAPYGDVDGDGYLTEKDTKLIQQKTNAVISFTYDQLKKADVNKDGIVDMADASLIGGHIAGSTTTFGSCSGNNVASITVISPTGGETYTPGQQITVKWTSNNIIAGVVGILLADENNSIPFTNITYPTLNDGSEVIKLPITSGKNFKILISNDQTNGAYSKPFVITSSTNTCPAYVAPVTCPAFQTETIKDANGCIVKYQCKDMTKATEIIPTDGCSNGAIFNSITGARCTVDTKVCPASIPSETCPAYSYQEAIKDANGCVVRYQCKDISCTNGAIYSSRTGQLCSTSTVTAPYSNTTVQTPTTNDSTPAPSNNNTAPITRNLKRGVRGDDVRRVQEFLGIGADGVYGRGTTEAVRQWQIENGLKGDGIFGQGSYGKMLEELY